MNISETFIRRPVATTLLTVGVTLVGVVAFRFLPVSALPQVEFPTISVSANLPGASPETMATSVAAPLEHQFARIAGVTEMTSSSALGSSEHHLAIRTEPRYRRRGAGCSSRDHGGPRRSPGQSPQQTHVSQDQSGRRADSHSVLDLRHREPGPDVRRRLQHPSAEIVADRGRGAGLCGGRIVARSPCGFEPYGAEQVRDRSGRRTADAEPDKCESARRASSAMGHARGRSRRTINCTAPRIICP